MLDDDGIVRKMASEPRAPCPPPGPSADATESYWLAHGNDLADFGSKTALPDSQDVVVIGSGIAGVSAVWHLVNQLPREAKITLIEARDFCGSATGRNGGHLTSYTEIEFARNQEQFDTEAAKAIVALEHRSIDWLTTLIEEHDWKDVQLERSGSLTLCDTLEAAANFARGLKAAKAAGVNVDGFTWFTEEELLETYGVRGFPAGLLNPPGSTLWPMRLVTHLWEQAAEKARLKKIELHLHTRTPAHSVVKDGDGWRVRTGRGEVSTRFVVHCTNGSASSLIPALASGPQAVLPSIGQIIAAKPQRQPVRSIGYVDSSDQYGNPRPDGYVVLGGGGPGSITFGEHDDSKLSERKGSYLRSFLSRHFIAFEKQPRSWLGSLFDGLLRLVGWTPGIALGEDVVSTSYEWTGVLGYTPNHQPLVGPLVLNGQRVPGQFINVGCNGHGMPRMPAWYVPLNTSLTSRSSEAVARFLESERAGLPAPELDWLPKPWLTA